MRRLISYWENKEKTPRHIVVCIAIMAAKLGDRFLLLTPKNVRDYIGSEHEDKEWKIEGKPHKNPIAVKSDYIRMKYIYDHGGFWLDADALCLGDPSRLLTFLDTNPIVWQSENLFGAQPRMHCFRDACERMLRDEFQKWGNPGRIKWRIKHQMMADTFIIPLQMSWPRPQYNYWWNTTDILFREDIEAKDFMSNEQIIIQLFNSVLRKIETNGATLFDKLVQHATREIDLSRHISRVRKVLDG